MELSIGSTVYRLVTPERDGQWTAHAVRADSGERYGVETTSQVEQDAASRLAGWLEWQHDHTQALEALQQAERAYHRALADAAFAVSADSQAPGGSKASLDAVDAPRAQLDDVRARRPNV